MDPPLFKANEGRKRMKRKIIVFTVAMYACQAMAFVGGGYHGGGYHGGGYRGGSHGGGRGKFDDLLGQLIVYFIAFIFKSMDSIYCNYRKKAPWLKEHLKKRQQSYIKKCIYPVKSPLRLYSAEELKVAKQIVEFNAMENLLKIKIINKEWKQLDVLKNKACNLFLDFQDAWVNRDVARLAALTNNEKYLKKLERQIEAFDRLDIVNHIDETIIDDVVLLSVKYDRFSSVTRCKVAIKGKHIDEYLTKSEPLLKNGRMYEKRAFNTVMIFDINPGSLAMNNLIFKEHVDDVLFRESRNAKIHKLAC